jgi:hypothetical protein
VRSIVSHYGITAVRRGWGREAVEGVAGVVRKDEDSWVAKMIENARCKMGDKCWREWEVKDESELCFPT